VTARLGQLLAWAVQGFLLAIVVGVFLSLIGEAWAALGG